MTTLAADKPRDYKLGTHEAFPVIASDIIYEGAAVGDNGSGYARPLQAGDVFLGFCEIPADNSTGSAGDKYVRVKRDGYIKLPVTSLAITDVGKDVYASDDDTFVLTQSTNTRIGSVRAFVSSGVGIVEFEATECRIAKLTDSTTGTAGGTVSDVGASFNQTTLNNNFASITAKLNAILQRGQ